MNRWIILSENRNYEKEPNGNCKIQKYNNHNNSQDGFNSRLDTAKGKISKLEDRITESIQVEAHREKRTEKKKRA